MREITRFFTRYYWEEVYGTLLGSVIVLLVSLFFANFDNIFGLYNPLVRDVPNPHPGIMGIFQLLLWPAFASTAVSLVAGSIKVVYDFRHRGDKPKTDSQPGASDEDVGPLG